MSHLTVDEVVRLRTAAAGSVDYRRAVRHLAAGCRECALAMAALVGEEQLEEMMAGTAGYDQVIEDLKRRMRALL